MKCECLKNNTVNSTLQHTYIKHVVTSSYSDGTTECKQNHTVLNLRQDPASNQFSSDTINRFRLPNSKLTIQGYEPYLFDGYMYSVLV